MRAMMTGNADDGTEDRRVRRRRGAQAGLRSIDKPGEKNVATVKKPIESVPKLVVIVFAHWCSEDALPRTCSRTTAAMEGVDKDAKVGLINGESMPPESLSGDALLPLEYFPSCACVEAGKLVIKPFEECMKSCRPPAPATSAGRSGLGGRGASAKVATLFAVAPEEGPAGYASLF